MAMAECLNHVLRVCREKVTETNRAARVRMQPDFPEEQTIGRMTEVIRVAVL